MPVFSSKMTLFGKSGLSTIIGMVSLCFGTHHSPRSFEWSGNGMY